MCEWYGRKVTLVVADIFLVLGALVQGGLRLS